MVASAPRAARRGLRQEETPSQQWQSLERCGFPGAARGSGRRTGLSLRGVTLWGRRGCVRATDEPGQGEHDTSFHFKGLFAPTAGFSAASAVVSHVGANRTGLL